MARSLEASPGIVDGFLDWFERHKFGVIGTLLLHSLVLFTLVLSEISNAKSPEELAQKDIEVTPPLSDQEFFELEQQLAQNSDANAPNDLQTLVSNITAQRAQTAGISRAEQERMAGSVEQDLQAFEQAEFERLAQERRERGEEVVIPPLDPSKWNKELYMEKRAEPAKVEGNVAVEHDLAGRSHQQLDVPAYTCKGAGRVAVKVSVSRDGTVRNTDIDPARTTTSDACMVEGALASAASARFNALSTAPDPQRGTILYTFIAQ